MANELCSEFGASLAAITDHPKPNSQLIFLNVSCPLSPFQHLDFWLQYTMGTIIICNPINRCLQLYWVFNQHVYEKLKQSEVQ